MPWVELTENFDWKHPVERQWLAFTPGVRNMTRAQADEAIALGKGKETSRPSGEKDDEPEVTKDVTIQDTPKAGSKARGD